MAAPEVVSSILSLLAPLHRLGLLKPPALVSGVGEEFSEARSRQQPAYSALPAQVPHRLAEACLIRLLALDLVLAVVVLARREEGGLAVMHNQPNLTKEASYLVAQEHRTLLGLPLAVRTPPPVAASLEADKVLLASEANSRSSRSSSSKDLQILLEDLALIRTKARVVTRQDLDLAEVSRHQSREDFSERLLAQEGPARGYLATFRPIMHNSLKREAFSEPTTIIRWEGIRFLGQSRRRQEDLFLVSILQTRRPPAGAGFSILPDLEPTIIALRISRTRGVVCSMPTTSSSSPNYLAPAIRPWQVGYSILTATHNNWRLAAHYSGIWVPILKLAFSQAPTMRLISTQMRHNRRAHCTLRNLR